MISRESKKNQTKKHGHDVAFLYHLRALWGTDWSSGEHVRAASPGEQHVCVSRQFRIISKGKKMNLLLALPSKKDGWPPLYWRCCPNLFTDCRLGPVIMKILLCVQQRPKWKADCFQRHSGSRTDTQSQRWLTVFTLNHHARPQPKAGESAWQYRQIPWLQLTSYLLHSNTHWTA